MQEQLQIRVWSFGPVIDRELVFPVGDELGRVYDAPVNVTVVDREPDALGFTEIAMTAMVTGAVGLLYEFFKPLVTEAGERFRDKMLAVDQADRRSKESDRLYAAFRIELGTDYQEGPVRYTFHGRFDADGLLIRLRAADEHIRTIPPELFSGRGGPGPGFFWDKEQQRWRGSVWRGGLEVDYGEEWYPPDLWED